MSPKLFLGLLGLGVIGQKILQFVGTSELAKACIYAGAGGVTVGILADQGYNPMPHLITAGKMAIQAGEAVIKQLPEVKEITSDSNEKK